MQRLIKELGNTANKEEEVDFLSRKEEKTKKGPISKLLQNYLYQLNILIQKMKTDLNKGT